MVVGGLEPLPADRDKQPFILTFTPTGNQESPINLIHMSLDCGRNPEHPEGGNPRRHRDRFIDTGLKWK